VPLGLDLRTRTTLVCGTLALAIAASTLLRGKVRPVHWLFAGFAGDIGLWYLSQSLFGFFQSAIWERFTAILAVLLPQFALHLFDAILPHEGRRRSRLLRVAGLLAVPMAVLALSSLQSNRYVRISIFLYVFALITAGLYELGRRGRESLSRAAQRRVGFLVVIGALAGLASVADFAWFLLPKMPPVGAVFSIVFLFVLAQALRHERLLDMYEILSRLLVATAVAFLIAGIFYVLLTFIGGFNTMYLNAVLGAITILVVFDPLRARVEEQIQRVFFRERFELERSIAGVRQRLVHTLEVDEMASSVMAALEQSRRVTAAVLYLHDSDGTGFDKLASLGSRTAPERVEVATARALLDRLGRGALDLEQLARDVRERKARGERTESDDAVLAAAAVLGRVDHGVVLGIRAAEEEFAALLVVSDDRVRDAFSPDEVALLELLAAPMAVVIQNSRAYARMKERDRLAVLGQMAAGLAHEIRNPLGAIKGAAQLLADPGPDVSLDASQHEFLGIIVEEVDRLDRVVGSVLDLARSNQDVVVPIDVNAVVRRTVQVLSPERGDDLTVEVVLDAALPRVAVDPEQLRQVVMNLMRNAAQAMKNRGKITLMTRTRLGRATRPGLGAADEALVELIVADNGPGISQKVLENIFLPFFTTKDKGTGLGLAVSQRIVQGAGGRIDVRTYEGKGSTFAILLPAAMDALGTPTPTLAAPSE
jgi:nitrogen-specific signal transduction histidine kinase